MNAPSLGFAVAPLTPAIGGLVTGIDLARPISDAVISKLKAAVAERHVLFFDGQALDPAAHRRFAARFGKLHAHPVYPHVDDLPEITSIETRPGDLPDNDNWNTDVTFIETPPFGAVLTPRTLPSSGGDTLWGSNVAAYRMLSAPLRGLLDKLTAEHSFETGFPRRRWGAGQRKEKWERAVAANPPVVHPVVRTIEGGRRGLFVNSGLRRAFLSWRRKRVTRYSPSSSPISRSLSSQSVGIGSLATSPFGTIGSALTMRRSTTCRRSA